MKENTTKVPPVPVFNLVSGFLNGLKKLQQRIIPPHALLVSYTVEYIVIQRCLYIVAVLGIADLLKDGPKDIGYLAKETNTNEGFLYRIMKPLAGEGLFKETKGKHFETTRIGKALELGDKNSVLPLIRWVGSESINGLFVDLMNSAKNGKSYFENNYGEGYFDWLEKHPHDQDTFNDCLIVFSTLSNDFVAAAYNFSKFNTLVDVAGGRGGQLVSILKAHPKLKGILFELPFTVGLVGVDNTFEKAGLSDRVTLIEGDFFESIAPGYDAYILKSILHDWTDEQAVKILSTCRKAMRDDSTLLIAELVINEGNKPHFSRIISLCMAALNNGQERSREEYSILLEKAGFKLTRVVPTSSPYSIVEAKPV